MAVIESVTAENVYVVVFDAVCVSACVFCSLCAFPCQDGHREPVSGDKIRPVDVPESSVGMNCSVQRVIIMVQTLHIAIARVVSVCCAADLPKSKSHPMRHWPILSTVALSASRNGVFVCADRVRSRICVLFSLVTGDSNATLTNPHD